MAGNNLTKNINLLAPTGFKLVINREKFSNIEFFITTFTIPDISLNAVEQAFRGKIYYTSGEGRQFGDLSVRFAIDEDMKNYTEVYDWMFRNTTNAKKDAQCEKHDMTLSVMSSHNNVNKEFRFKDAFPTSLSGVEFSSQTTDVEFLQSDVSFRYSEFEIIK